MMRQKAKDIWPQGAPPRKLELVIKEAYVFWYIHYQKFVNKTHHA